MNLPVNGVKPECAISHHISGALAPQAFNKLLSRWKQARRPDGMI
jgi:hypothetical protein